MTAPKFADRTSESSTPPLIEPFLPLPGRS
jgi:hypothetical protein